MPRGNALALNYEIPQRFIGQEEQQQIPNSVAPQNPIQNPAELLAHRENLTRQYFDINSQLDSYVTSMAKDYGIDVTKPDFTQPGGGEGFNTFNKLSSSLLYTANDLARSAKIDDEMLKQSAQGNIRMQQGYDPRTQLSSQMSPEQMFYSTKLDPQVDQANEFLNKDFYTTADAENANVKIREPLVNYYNNLIKNDPENAAYYERQKAALGTATRKTPYSAFQQRGGASSNTGLGVLKKITNLSKGVWTPGTYKTTTRNGKVYVENNEMIGDSMGQYVTYKNGQPVYLPKIVKSWLKDPDTGDVFIEFQDENIPIEQVSNQPGSAVTATFMSNNAKYGDSAKMLDKATELGIMDDTGSSIDEALLPENYKQMQENVKTSASEQSKTIASEVQRVKDSLSKPSHNWYTINTKIPFKLPTGEEIKIEKTGEDEFEILDYKKHLQSGSDHEGLSSDRVISILDRLGYFNQFIKSKPEDVKQKANDLINKYSK